MKHGSSEPLAPAGPARRPGRPRSEQVEDAILDAAINLLSQGVSYDGLSIEQIASTAGVGKAAIYRRWANKEALVLATLRRTFHSTPRTSPQAPRGAPPHGKTRTPSSPPRPR